MDYDYFEIEDKYGNFIRFDNAVIYPSKCGPISVFFHVFSYARGFNISFIDDDFSIDNGIEKINCYISFKTYSIIKQLDFKYIYHKLQ